MIQCLGVSLAAPTITFKVGSPGSCSGSKGYSGESGGSPVICALVRVAPGSAIDPLADVRDTERGTAVIEAIIPSRKRAQVPAAILISKAPRFIDLQ